MLEPMAKKLQEEMNGLKEDISNYMMSELSFESILDADPANLKMLSRSYKVMNFSAELLVEQAKAIDEINEKLDKVLIKLSQKD